MSNDAYVTYQCPGSEVKPRHLMYLGPSRPGVYCPLTSGQNHHVSDRFMHHHKVEASASLSKPEWLWPASGLECTMDQLWIY